MSESATDTVSGGWARRYGLIALFLIVLIAPILLRAALTRGGAAGDAGVTEEGRTAAEGPVRRLVIVTPHNQDIRREFARAFDRWHRRQFGQGVSIDYRTPGGTNDIRRLLEKTYGASRDADGNLPPPDRVTPDLDIVWGGGDYTFNVELKPLGVLQPLDLPDGLLAAAFPTHDLAGINLYDYDKAEPVESQRPTWVGVCLSSFGIVYNPDVYSAIGMESPTSWFDLAKPELAGQVALADPTHSGSAAVAYMMVLQRAMADAEEAYLAGGGSKDDPAYQHALADGWHRGMGRLLLIAANSRYFTDSASQVPNDVAHGDAAAGMAIDFYGRVNQELMGDRRIRYVSPIASTAITPDPVAILYGVKGERLETATRFVTFLLTPQGQRLWITRPGTPDGPRDRGLRRPPIRRDVYADPEALADWSDDVNPFEESGGFNQRAEWMATFTIARQLWAAGWIDARTALKRAHRRILSIGDDDRRATALEALADSPVTMQYVLDLRAAQRLATRRGTDGWTPENEAELTRLAHAIGEPVDARFASDEWAARWRIGWAERFRRHYRDVAATHTRPPTTP